MERWKNCNITKFSNDRGHWTYERGLLLTLFCTGDFHNAFFRLQRRADHESKKKHSQNPFFRVKDPYLHFSVIITDFDNFLNFDEIMEDCWRRWAMKLILVHTRPRERFMNFPLYKTSYGFLGIQKLWWNSNDSNVILKILSRFQRFCWDSKDSTEIPKILLWF